MKAEIIAVGTELLLGQVVNTNAAEIARMLAPLGIGVYHQTVVGDNAGRLSQALDGARNRVDLVVVCGGLGPTEDDLTRETLSELLGRPLREDSRWTAVLRKRFSGYSSLPVPQNNLRQAMVPEGADLLPNSCGTAPGIWLASDSATFVLVPGPPREMRAMMEEQVLPRLARELDQAGTRRVLVSRILRVVGLGESRVAEMLAPLLAAQTNPTVAPLAQAAEMSLRITAEGKDHSEAENLIETTARKIRAILGDAIYGEDEVTLEAAVGALLAQRHCTLAVAESCTGGLLGMRLSSAPGSSAYFTGGVIAYSYALKSALLGVDPQLLERHGAVSEEVARAMASGALRACKSDYAVAITGIAGPGGATADKPLGLTYIAMETPEGSECRRFTFSGDRETNRYRASQAALEMLRTALLPTAAWR